MRLPTPLGLWAITPRPMTPEQVVDLVALTRENEARVAPARQVAHRREANIQRTQARRKLTARDVYGMREAAERYVALKPHPKRGSGRAGAPSALSATARAALARTAEARR